MTDQESRSKPSESSSTENTPMDGKEAAGAQTPTTPGTGASETLIGGPAKNRAPTSPPSQESAVPEPAAELPGESERIASTPPRTLEEELKSDDFASRGWLPLTELTDYLAHLVDGRSAGYLKADPATNARVLHLATVLKATTQWFADEPSDREPPRFIIEAEKYLADGPIGLPIVRQGAEDRPSILRSGPVASRRGARGSAGRIHAMTELKRRLMTSVSQLSQGELNDRQAEYRDRLRAGTSCEETTAHAIAFELLLELAQGMFAETLLTQGFRWSFDEQLPKMPTSSETVLTGGGGRHFYFSLPPGTTSVRSSTLAPGIDLQADGKLVIAPPSVHPTGELYQWANRKL